MSKQRFNFAFNLDSPDHARAYAELIGWPERKRGEYIIQAILKQADKDFWQKTVYEAVSRAFDARGTGAIAAQEQAPKIVPPPAPIQEPTEETIGEIPPDQMNFLMSLAGGAAKI